MKIGFDTIGNATIIVYDTVPVLATDPWVVGSAYFGSWRMSHEVPEEQMAAVKSCKFIWFSHGHPDHLNADSLHLFKQHKILLPNHVGGRIRDDLGRDGFDVAVLPNRVWTKLSDNVRVMCISDYYQDAILLVDVNGRLLVNTNDAIDRGWGRFARRIVREFPVSFLLALFGFGDADMVNFYDETGSFVPPKAAKRNPVGPVMAQAAESWGVDYVIPFSSMHRYQRSDSAWANAYVTHLDDYAVGFASKSARLLPAFVRYDCEADTFSRIDPPEVDGVVREPEEFGDNWSDRLEAGDVAAVSSYFRSVEHLGTFLDFVNVRVGGEDNVITLAARRFNRGITFEVPRGSLMTAVEYSVFDDLLIGNFMKTTLHGKWPKSGLYPDFTPYVARYADNARAYTREHLDAYFEEYRRREPVEFVLHKFEQKAVDVFRSRVTGGSPPFNLARKAYWYAKRVGGRAPRPAAP
jgi:hypothetical protein